MGDPRDEREDVALERAEDLVEAPGRLLGRRAREPRLQVLVRRRSYDRAGIAGSHRYRLTRDGLRTALFYARVYQRLLRPGLSILHAPDSDAAPPHALQSKLAQLEAMIDRYAEEKLAA